MCLHITVPSEQELPLYSFLFLHSPDFRTRASSNASSCGRLSPIPSGDSNWAPYYGPSPEQLAGSLESSMRIEHPPPPQFVYTTPPPYHPPGTAPFPYTQCLMHRGHQVCNCHQRPTVKQVINTCFVKCVRTMSGTN